MGVLRVLILALVLAVVGIVTVYVAAPATFLRGALMVERSAAGLKRKEASVAGLRMVYLDSGGAGAPLLLVHGFGGDKDNFTRLARHFDGRFRVIAPDLSGYGESESPLDAAYGIAPQVERLHAFVQGLGLTRVHLGGSSMGGNIAAHYAIAYPNEVGSLWLISNSGVATAPPSEFQKQLATPGAVNTLIPGTVQEYRAMLAFVMSRPPLLPAAVVDVLAQRAVAAKPLRERQFADLMAERATLEERIKGLPVPTHILWGSEDRALNVGGAEVLKALLPSASVTVMPGIGHVPMMEAPAETAQDYLAFRDRIGL